MKSKLEPGIPYSIEDVDIFVDSLSGACTNRKLIVEFEPDEVNIKMWNNLENFSDTIGDAPGYMSVVSSLV